MTLDEVAAHSRVGFGGAFKVHFGVILEGAEICTAEGLRRDADFEPGCVVGCDREACSFCGLV